MRPDPCRDRSQRAAAPLHKRRPPGDGQGGHAPIRPLRTGGDGPAGLAQATSTTIMMYMCGTDLQSACVMDMYEMASVDVPDNVTIAVQAGGAYEWDDSDLTPNALNRFTIADGGFYDLEVLDWASMGEQQTLVDFLKWGVSNHPADRYMLVLWNHGGGAASGRAAGAGRGGDGDRADRGVPPQPALPRPLRGDTGRRRGRRRLTVAVRRGLR